MRLSQQPLPEVIAAENIACKYHQHQPGKHTNGRRHTPFAHV